MWAGRTFCIVWGRDNKVQSAHRATILLHGEKTSLVDCSTLPRGVRTSHYNCLKIHLFLWSSGQLLSWCDCIFPTLDFMPEKRTGEIFVQELELNLEVDPILLGISSSRIPLEHCRLIYYCWRRLHIGRVVNDWAFFFIYFKSILPVLANLAPKLVSLFLLLGPPNIYSWCWATPVLLTWGCPSVMCRECPGDLKTHTVALAWQSQVFSSLEQCFLSCTTLIFCPYQSENLW